MKEKGIHDIKLFFYFRGSMMVSFRDPLCYPVQEKVTESVAEIVVNTVNKPEVCALAKIFNKI